MATQSESVVEALSESQCWALLRDVPIGRIALRSDDEIEVCKPVTNQRTSA